MAGIIQKWMFDYSVINHPIMDGMYHPKMDVCNISSNNGWHESNGCILVPYREQEAKIIQIWMIFAWSRSAIMIQFWMIIDGLKSSIFGTGLYLALEHRTPAMTESRCRLWLGSLWRGLVEASSGN